MKKYIFLLIFMSTISFGQKLTVTPSGLKNSDDINLSYVVINVDGKNSKELYQNTIKYITKNYSNPDQVIKAKIENEYIRFVTHVDNFITIKNSFAKVKMSTDYAYEMSFKDGKIKFEITSLSMYDSSKIKLDFKGAGFLSGYYIYNNDLELKKPDAKEAIENYFNNQIIDIINFIKSSNDEKW